MPVWASSSGDSASWDIVNQRGEEVLVGEAMLAPPRPAATYIERKTGPGAVVHWSLQPALWSAHAAGAWARLGASLFAAWRVDLGTRQPH